MYPNCFYKKLLGIGLIAIVIGLSATTPPMPYTLYLPLVVRSSPGLPPPAPTPVPTQVPTPTPTSTPGNTIRTVFIIVMENKNWSEILNSSSAPYINKTLLPQASYTQQYYNPTNLHPSEPNYLWLEAGTAFGIAHDSTPSTDHQNTTNHLVTYLEKAGISWKAYEEGISGTNCPLTDAGLYAPRHNPMVYFDDVTNTNNQNSAHCMAHERPFNELKNDLANNTVARYNFITPDVCNDMHNSSGCASSDMIKNGDNWLAMQVPMILNSQAYKQSGALFITWDESENGEYPIGMIVLSPAAKGGGYSNSIHYTHSSTLRTIQEIFGVSPFLGDANQSNDLSDLFRQFP